MKDVVIEAPKIETELTVKESIIKFIKTNKKVRSKDIKNKYGSCGSVTTYISQLKESGNIIEKYFECGTCKYFEWVKK